MHRTRRALLATLLIALTVSLGFALAGVPNVELMTIAVFISGYLLGVRLGVTIGGASTVLHSVFNPLGAALPPLLLAQIVGFSIVGAAGALAGPVVSQLQRRSLAFVFAGVLGFVLTLIYDVLTSVGAFFTITGERAPVNLLQFVLAGLLFVAVHIVWNTGLFSVVLKPVLGVLARYRHELSEGA